VHRKSLLAGLLGPLLAWGVLEAATHTGWWADQVRAGPVGTVHHARALLDAEPDADVLVIGSSVALLNVRPDRLSDQLAAREGRRPTVVDAGVNGSPLAVTAMFTDRLWDTPDPDGRVVLVVAAADLADRIPIRRVRAYDIGLAGRLFSPSELWAERDEHLDAALGAVSRAWHQRFLPRTLVDHHLHPPPHDHPREIRSLPARPQRLVSLRKVHRAMTFSDDSANARGLEHLAERVRASGRSLYIVPAPQDPGLVGRPFHHEVVSRLAKNGSRLGYRLVLPTEWPVWTSAHFRDPIHLAPQGQRPFTDGIAQLLAR
jgi:hypothetical protein